MTDHAQIAIDNAWRAEAKKDRLAQRQSGDWTVTFTVSSTDIPREIIEAPMGTRFMLAGCEIADDETPVVQPTDEPTESEEQSARAIDEIRANQDKPDLHHYSRQAAMRCNEPMFQNFLNNKHFEVIQAVLESSGRLPTGPVEIASKAVRHICQVQSRAEFDTDPDAAKRWRGLMAEFDVWRGVA